VKVRQFFQNKTNQKNDAERKETTAELPSRNPPTPDPPRLAEQKAGTRNDR
jgi:hypothetical protein